MDMKVSILPAPQGGGYAKELKDAASMTVLSSSSTRVTGNSTTVVRGPVKEEDSLTGSLMEKVWGPIEEEAW